MVSYREPYGTPKLPFEPQIFEPYHLLSSSDTCQKEFLSDAHHCLQTILNYLCYCSEDRYQYDGLPQSEVKTYLDAVHKLAYAQPHKHHALMRKDAQETWNKHIPSLSLPRPSILSALPSGEGKHYAGPESYNDGNISEQLLELNRLYQLSRKSNGHFLQDQELAIAFLEFCTLISQDKNFQTIANMLAGNVGDDSFCNLYNSCIDDLHYTRVSNVNYHSVDCFYDFFVPVYNNYLTNGIVNHNSGKSWFVAEYIVDACLEKRTDVVCVREIQKTLSHSVKKLIEAQIDKMGLGNHFEVQESLIKTPHGGKIIFQGMQSHNADSIKSLESIDIAWVEEAQTLSQRSLDLLRPTIRNEGSQIIFTWNPDNETDPVDVLMRKLVPDKSIAIEVNYLNNPWFPDVLTGEMEWDKARDYDKYEHIWLGKYNVNSNARVFKNWRVEEFEADPGEIFRFGADWGYAVDPSVLVRCYVKGNNLYVDYEAYMVGCEIVNLPDLFLQIPESEKWPIVADSARPETISHMQRNGFPRIRPAVKGARSLEEGVNFLQSFDIIVHPRCVHTIDELKLYSYKVDPLTNDVLPMFEDKDNHIIDSLRYGLEGARRISKPTEYTKPTKAPVKHWLSR